MSKSVGERLIVEQSGTPFRKAGVRYLTEPVLTFRIACILGEFRFFEPDLLYCQKTVLCLGLAGDHRLDEKNRETVGQRVLYYGLQSTKKLNKSYNTVYRLRDSVRYIFQPIISK